jgi:hypothetical protein
MFDFPSVVLCARIGRSAGFSAVDRWIQPAMSLQKKKKRREKKKVDRVMSD